MNIENQNHEQHAQAAQEAQASIIRLITEAIANAIASVGPAPAQEPQIELYLGREKIYPAREGFEPDPEKMEKFSSVINDPSLRGSARIMVKDEHGKREMVYQMNKGEVKVDKYELVKLLGLNQDVQASQEQSKTQIENKTESKAATPSDARDSEIAALRSQVDSLTKDVENLKAQMEVFTKNVIPVLDNPRFREWAATTGAEVQQKTQNALGRLGNLAKNAATRAMDAGVVKEIAFTASQLTDKYGTKLQDGSAVYATDKYTYSKSADNKLSITSDHGVVFEAGRLTTNATAEDKTQLRAVASAYALIAPKTVDATVTNQILPSVEQAAVAPVQVKPTILQIQVAEDGQSLGPVPITKDEAVAAISPPVVEKPAEQQILAELNTQKEAVPLPQKEVKVEALTVFEATAIRTAAADLTRTFGSDQSDGNRVLQAVAHDYTLSHFGDVTISNKAGDIVFKDGKLTESAGPTTAALLREIPQKVAAVKVKAQAEAQAQTQQQQTKTPVLKR